MEKEDLDAVREVSRQCPERAQIFLTGEILEKRYTVEDRLFFYKLNAFLARPLFQQTRDMTMRMLRYDPRLVWQGVGAELLRKLSAAEDAYLTVKTLVEPGVEDYYDAVLNFYREARPGLPVLGKLLHRRTYDVRYQAAYLFAMLLFRKASYMGVDPSRHFALADTADFLKDLRGVDWIPLTARDESAVQAAAEAGKAAEVLVNAELETLTDLCDKRLGAAREYPA
jgi:hypothetical protein